MTTNIFAQVLFIKSHSILIVLCVCVCVREGFDLLADGLRPLSDCWNPLTRVLRHLPQSARKPECRSITWGNEKKNYFKNIHCL